MQTQYQPCKVLPHQLKTFTVEYVHLYNEVSHLTLTLSPTIWFYNDLKLFLQSLSIFLMYFTITGFCFQDLS